MKAILSGLLLASVALGAHAQDSTTTKPRTYAPVGYSSHPASSVGNVQTTGTRQMGQARSFVRGPKGGCYYISSGGKKVYVDRSYCK